MRVRAVLLVVTWVVAGCQPAPPEASSSAERSASAALALAEQHEPLGPEGQARESQIKLAEAGPLALVRPVDASALAAFPSTDAPELSEAARAVLTGLDLPVLLPDEPALLSVALPTAGATWYAVSMTGDGHHVYLHATRGTHRLAIPLAEARGAPTFDTPRVTFNESSPVLTFTAGGVSYSLFVECESPLADARCTEEAYVRELAGELARFEGGQP